MRSLSFLSANILLAWYPGGSGSVEARPRSPLLGRWGGGVGVACLEGLKRHRTMGGDRFVLASVCLPSSSAFSSWVTRWILAKSKPKLKASRGTSELFLSSFLSLDFFIFSNGIKETKQTSGSKVLRICPLSLVHAEWGVQPCVTQQYGGGRQSSSPWRREPGVPSSFCRGRS